VTGVAEIGNLGMIGTAIRAACAQNVTLSGEFYSGYDGACQYQVQLVWGPPTSSSRRRLDGDVSATAVGLRQQVTPRYIQTLFESEGRRCRAMCWAASRPGASPADRSAPCRIDCRRDCLRQ
jgi:hypothetical protein